MNPAELRALAGAIVYRDSLAIARAADYLRACADAQPVRAVPIGHALSAVRHVGSANYPDRERAAIERLYSAEFDAYTHPAPAAPAGYKLVPVEPTPEMLQAGANVMEPNGIGWYDADISRAEYRAMLAAAPAAPQAEPKRRSILQAVARGWCHPKNSGKEMDVDLADAIVDEVMAINQAEPKRPAFLDEIDRAKEHVASWPQWMKDATVSAAATLPVTEPKREAQAFVARCGNGIEGRAVPLYPHAAAPQPEPKRDWSVIDAAIREYLDGYEMFGENDAGADACYTPTERERDLIYDAINGLLADESFVAAISAPQAEPKREPLTARRILEIEDDAIRQWRDNGMIDDHAVVFARMIERAHGIGGSDAE